MALTPEQLALITAFRLETEDLFKALTRQIYFKNGVGPYANEADVLATIPLGERVAYLTLVNIMGVDYWFTDSTTLVPYVGSLSLADGAVTLAKMANMATASFIGRIAAGAGSPEVLSVATVLSMLGLTDVVSILANKVDKAAGYSLVLNTLISQIHAPGSDDQDLTAIITSINALQEAVAKVPYRIILPAASTVAGRCVTPTELPTDWTVSEGTSDQDLLITHTLDTRKPVAVFIWANMPGGEREMQGSLAKVGFLAPSSTTLVIESLCTKEYPIRIEILFN